MKTWGSRGNGADWKLAPSRMHPPTPTPGDALPAHCHHRGNGARSTPPATHQHRPTRDTCRQYTGCRYRDTSARTAGCHAARLPTWARRSCARKHSTAEPRRRRTPVRGLMTDRRPCRTRKREARHRLATHKHRHDGMLQRSRLHCDPADSELPRSSTHTLSHLLAQQGRSLSHSEQPQPRTKRKKRKMEQRKRRLLWVAGTVAAAGAGAYLLYRTW